MLLCDDARPDPDVPTCVDIKCLKGNIVSFEDPPFPLLLDVICVYLVLTACHGTGLGQIRVAYADGEHERPLFGSAERTLDFTEHSPLDLLGVTFRIEACNFPQAGRYLVQFWYNGEKLEERPLRLRGADA